MARRTKDVSVPAGRAYERDRGKVYRITEMPASRGEKWAIRALQAMARGGVDIDDDLLAKGWVGIAVVGFRGIGGIAWPELEPLLDEMMECVTIVRVPSQPEQSFPLMRDPGEVDIEEIATRIFLRQEVLELHVGFSLAGDPSTSTSIDSPAPTSRHTPTSHPSRAA